MDSRGKARNGAPSKGNSQQSTINLPRRSSGASAKMESPAEAAHDGSAEKVLCDLLFAAKASVLKGSAVKESAYELERILPFLPQRSRETVEQEVSKIIVKLIDLRGPSPQHRMVAYANVGQQLIAEIDSLIFNPDTQRLKELERKYDELKREKEVLHRNLTQEIASRDIEIARLKDQQSALDQKLQSMSQENTGIQLELEKLLRDRIQTHQNSVELRMQGLDFKAEVDRRSGNILSSVQARMGFVPVGIEKQVELLRALKAPGDPSYDQVRQFRAMKIPTVDAESYVSGLGSGSGISSDGAKRSPKYSSKPPSPYSRSSPLVSVSLEEDWELNATPSSPIRSKTSTPTNAGIAASAESRRARPASAPARRHSPRTSVPSPRAAVGSPILSPRELASPPMASPVISSGKYISGGGGAVAASADSASIVRKIRARNLDGGIVGEREPNGKTKGSPVSGIGVAFNTLNGTVVKSGSPVRGSVEVRRATEDGGTQPTVTIPTAPMIDNCSDEGTGSSGADEVLVVYDDVKKQSEFRERRSSSGATSTGLSSSGTY